MRNVRKPKDIDGCHLELYWEQFAEPGDKPNITTHVEGDCFVFRANHPDKSELKRMRDLAKWISRAADYIERQLAEAKGEGK
jgi:hypothetical protein